MLTTLYNYWVFERGMKLSHAERELVQARMSIVIVGRVISRILVWWTNGILYMCVCMLSDTYKY